MKNIRVYRPTARYQVLLKKYCVERILLMDDRLLPNGNDSTYEKDIKKNWIGRLGTSQNELNTSRT